ncbi:DUF1684 domain-containing protein [Hymenobacter sp. 15J16-1T3B]|uniref:DUF1684 domain-containing protein n=1 Tax=Hymenobacter sp. 15J16-1T3B TaxID=2886941 RepID=UPI001D0F9C60|nr:DUF1684 domain-containing protein [Hymenobacter sp. 15J16-1T3B]MCC3155827.1 DUF1684 domain-containing protein [Hymenobacter sp. 15J16-1T3B]
MKHAVLRALGTAAGLSSWLPAAAQTPARLSPAAHQQAVATFQQELNAEYRDPARSPLSATAQAAFQGLPFYPVDYAYYVPAYLVRDAQAQPFPMKTTTVRQPMYRKFGELHFRLQGRALKLTVYESLDLKQKPGYEDYLLLPFTDLTNGRGSYGGGRYLDLRVPPGDTIRLDFNQAYNPFCAYSAQYSCPVPPPENRLPIAVKAGVQNDH